MPQIQSKLAFASDKKTGMLFETVMRTKKLFMWTRSCTCIPSSHLVPRYNARILMRHFAEEEGEELTSVFVLYYCPFRGACAPSIPTHMLKEEGETGSCGWVTNTEVEDRKRVCMCCSSVWNTLEPKEWISLKRASLYTHDETLKRIARNLDFATSCW